MDESSLFHYASDSPWVLMGRGAGAVLGGPEWQSGGKSFTWKIKKKELMDIFSPSKLSLRVSATLQAPVQDKQELPCAICPFLL